MHIEFDMGIFCSFLWRFFYLSVFPFVSSSPVSSLRVLVSHSPIVVFFVLIIVILLFVMLVFILYFLGYDL